MKVLWFSNTPSLAAEILHDKGNLGGWIVSLEKELVKVKGITLAVAFPFGYEEKKQFKIADTSYYSFPYTPVKAGVSGVISRWKHEIEHPDIIGNFLNIVEHFKPDIIHIFGTENSYGLIIDKVSVPVIIQIQGNLSVYEKKWFSGLNRCSILRQSNLNMLIRAFGIWHEFFLFQKRAKRERELMSKCSYFIGRTDWDRRITSVLSPKRKYFHCDELLRTEFYKTERWTKPNQSKIILVSTLSSLIYKGMEAILEAAGILVSKKLLDFEWQVVGLSGKEEAIRIIERTYNRKFIDTGIRFIGNLSPDALMKALLQADCYIHPSHIENSPNSVCEAMLLGVPVIATYAGGTSSLITNGIEGLLVQDGDPYSLAGAIYELCNDDNLKMSLSVNASKRAEERHDPVRVIKDLLSIYNTVLQDNIDLNRFN
jgi:glycosyltransferase involved in cell wall biosynthesis